MAKILFTKINILTFIFLHLLYFLFFALGFDAEFNWCQAFMMNKYIFLQDLLSFPLAVHLCAFDAPNVYFGYFLWLDLKKTFFWDISQQIMIAGMM